MMETRIGIHTLVTLITPLWFGVVFILTGCSNSVDSPFVEEVDTLTTEDSFPGQLSTGSREPVDRLGELELDGNVVDSEDGHEEQYTGPEVSSDSCAELSCDDNNPCTEDDCNPMVGCVFTDISEQCDDGISCTNDFCDEIIGCVHSPDNSLCESQGFCQAGICDPTSGCSSEVVVNCCGNGITEEGEDCDDGNLVDGDGCSALCTCSGSGVLVAWESVNVTGGDTHQANDSSNVNNMSYVMEAWTDGITGPQSGEEGGNKSYNVCFYYDFDGSRAITVSLKEPTKVSQINYFSSNNAGGGVLPPIDFSIELLPSNQIVITDEILASGWNSFTFVSVADTTDVIIRLTKQSEHSCVSEIEVLGAKELCVEE